jgi:anti-sigma factor RsiW
MAEPRVACLEWQDDIAAWVLAQGTPERERALVAHLATCDRCREEADSLLAVAAVGLVVDPEALGPLVEPPVDTAPLPVYDDVEVEPPSDLADRISARIRGERRRSVLRRSLVAAVGAAAAAIVLVVALGLRGDPGPAALHGRHLAFSEVPAGATADVVVAKDDVHGSLVQLHATGLDPSTTYALWLTPPGGSYNDRVPAGTFRPDRHGDVDVRLHSALPSSDVGRVWATTPDRQLALDTA